MGSNLSAIFRSYHPVVILAVLAFVPVHTNPLVAEEILFRISVENTADHVQTRAVRRFSEALQEEGEGRFDVRLYHSGSLFRDADVLAALHRDQVEMAVPGTWQIDRYEPDVAVFLLPRFFGRDIGFQHRHADGPLGQEVTGRIETTLDVVVPGRWFDLGHGHLFFTDKAVRSHDQLKGMLIRVAGGRANELRVEALGASAVTIPWGEVPERLERRQMDGLLTTFESVRSGRLWEYGVRFALEDFQYMPQYIPMIRSSLWARLDETDREMIRRLWEQQVDPQRTAAARAQDTARELLRNRGVEIVPVNPGELESIRRGLLERELDFIRRLGIDPAILDLMDDRN